MEKNKSSRGFKKGHIPWNKGIKTGARSAETIKNNSIAQKKYRETHPIWNKGKKGLQVGWNKGIPRSEETRRKISESLTGRKLKPFTEEHKAKIGAKHKGKKYGEATRQKIREARLKQVFSTKNTSIEIALQEELTRRKIEYDTHTPLCKVCIPDIVFKERKIAVFADGDYWHSLETAIKRDAHQNKVLKENDWTVLRFWGHEIRENVVECVDQITKFL